MKQSLYELTKESMEISDILAENEGELTPELEARLDALMVAGPDRIEAAAIVVQQIEYDASMCELEAKRLRERAAALDDQSQKLKRRMVIALDAAFGGKVKTPLFGSVWAQSTAKTTVVDLAPGYTPEMLRDEYPDMVIVKVEPNRGALLRAFKAGQKLPETVFFTDNPPTRYLRIQSTKAK